MKGESGGERGWKEGKEREREIGREGRRKEGGGVGSVRLSVVCRAVRSAVTGVGAGEANSGLDWRCCMMVLQAGRE